MRLRCLAVVLLLAAGACDRWCRDTIEELDIDTIQCPQPGGGTGPGPTTHVVEVRMADLARYTGRHLVVEIVRVGDTVLERRDVTAIDADAHVEVFRTPNAARAIAWIDADGDGTCDAPPADAAWNLGIENGHDVTLTIDARTPMTRACP